MSVKLRERKLAKGAVKFYLDIYHNKNRHYEFLDIKIEATDNKTSKAEKKKLAELIRSNREIELITEDTDYIPKHIRSIRFKDYAKSFIDEYQKKDIRMIIAANSKFMEFVSNKNLKLSDINPSIMNGFKDFLNDKAGLSGDSPHNYYTRFKKILKDAQNKGLIKSNPADGIKFRKKRNSDDLTKQVLTSEELQTLAETRCGNNEVKKAFYLHALQDWDMPKLRH
ncbi:phage integrase SAM-like domain and Arm DNA-binding domain-containing protein [Winogradskyella sp. PC D3.3]